MAGAVALLAWIVAAGSPATVALVASPDAATVGPAERSGTMKALPPVHKRDLQRTDPPASSRPAPEGVAAEAAADGERGRATNAGDRALPLALALQCGTGCTAALIEADGRVRWVRTVDAGGTTSLRRSAGAGQTLLLSRVGTAPRLIALPETPNGPVALSLRRGAEASGCVTDRNGRPVANAEVRVRIPVGAPKRSGVVLPGERRDGRTKNVDRHGSWLHNGDLVRRVRTDAAGRWSVNELTHGESYIVEVAGRAKKNRARVTPGAVAYITLE